MFVGIGFKGLEEGGRGFYEEHALSPACRHCGRDRERGWKGEKGWREREWLYESWVGRFGRVSAGAVPIPFPSGPTRLDRDPGARHDNRSKSETHLSSNVTIFVYIVSARLQAGPLAMCSITDHPSYRRRLTTLNNLISWNVQRRAGQEAASSCFEGRWSRNQVLVE